MQNWNQWPLSTGASSLPQPSIGYGAPATGADATTMMQSYMQYYNQPVSISLNKDIIYFI